MPGRRLLRNAAAAGLAIGLAVSALPGPAQAVVEHGDVVDGSAVSYTPNLLATDQVSHPEVSALVSIGRTVYAGGRFTAVEDASGTLSYPRSFLVALDASTGVVRDFAPALDGPVWSVETDGTSLYVGGGFDTVNGVARRGLVKLDPVTGAVNPAFQPALGRGRVSHVRLVAGRLLVAGSFPGALRALDPVTGADTGYLDVAIEGKVPDSSGRTEVFRFATDPQATRLVAVGNFTTVGGRERPRAFMLTLKSRSVAVHDWYYNPFKRRCNVKSPAKQAYLRDVAFSPDGSWFVVGSTGGVPRLEEQIGRTVCDAVARFETSVLDPGLPTWINYTGGDTVWSVEVSGPAVYAQGHFRWLDNPYGRNSAGPGAVVRRGIGAIDPVHGTALAWAPSKPARRGGKDLLLTGEGLWVGSDSRYVNGEYHRGLAFFPLPSLSLP